MKGGREREDELVMCPAGRRERQCRNPHFKSSRILEGSRERDHWRTEEGDMVIGMERRAPLSFAEDVILLHIAQYACRGR